MCFNKSRLVPAMISLLLMGMLISVAYAYVETLTVNPNTVKAWWIEMNDTNKFVGSFSIAGGNLNVWVTNPQGTKILDFGTQSQGTSVEFTAQGSGAYTFHFDNTDSSNQRTVTISYGVQNLITTEPSDSADSTPSIPTDSLMWIFLIVLIIGVFAVIGFGIYTMSRSSRNKPQSPPPPQ